MLLFITSCTRTHLYGVENRIESERSSKDNEKRGGIEEGAQEKFLVLVSSLVSVHSKEVQLQAQVFNCVAVVAFFGYYFLDIPPESRVA